MPRPCSTSLQRFRTFGQEPVATAQVNIRGCTGPSSNSELQSSYDLAEARVLTTYDLAEARVLTTMAPPRPGSVVRANHEAQHPKAIYPEIVDTAGGLETPFEQRDTQGTQSRDNIAYRSWSR